MKYGLKKVHVVILCIVGLYVVALCASPFACVVWVVTGYNVCYMDFNSEDAEIWAANDIVFYMKFDEDAGTVLGATIVDGERIDLEVLWEGGFRCSGVTFLSYPYPEKTYVEDVQLLYGQITKNGKNKYTLSISTVYQPDNNPFPGYDTIAMTKYHESEIEWVDSWPVPIEG